MTKPFKQVKVVMNRNPNEFGIILVLAEEAREGNEVEVFGNLTGKVVWVYNLIIEVEGK